MAARIGVACPTCGKEFGLRLEPGIEDDALTYAAEQLKEECPDHEGKKWNFWDRVRVPGQED